MKRFVTKSCVHYSKHFDVHLESITKSLNIQWTHFKSPSDCDRRHWVQTQRWSRGDNLRDPGAFSQVTTYLAVHCTAPHYTALHWTALYWTALHCTELPCIELHCNTLYYTTQDCTLSVHTVLYFPSLHFTLVNCSDLFCFYFTLQQSQDSAELITSQWASLHCTLQNAHYTLQTAHYTLQTTHYTLQLQSLHITIVTHCEVMWQCHLTVTCIKSCFCFSS